MYDLQGVINVKMTDADVVIVKAHRLQRPDETIKIDLPDFFVYQLNARYKKWIMINGPTSKYYVEHICEDIEKELEMGDKQEDTVILQLPWASLQRLGGQVRFYRLANNE